MVNSVGFKELLKFLGTVAWSVVALEHKRLTKFCENHPEFLDYCMCGTVWKVPEDQIFGEVLSIHKKVKSIPVE